MSKLRKSIHSFICKCCFSLIMWLPKQTTLQVVHWLFCLISSKKILSPSKQWYHLKLNTKNGSILVAEDDLCFFSQLIYCCLVEWRLPQVWKFQTLKVHYINTCDVKLVSRAHIYDSYSFIRWPIEMLGQRHHTTGYITFKQQLPINAAQIK